MSLEPSDIEAIARRVAELLDTESRRGEQRYVDAATLARRLAIDRGWIYAHANELGAIRLGGAHGRLRFDFQHVSRVLDAGRPTRTARRGAKRSGPDRRRRAHAAVELIPYESSAR